MRRYNNYESGKLIISRILLLILCMAVMAALIVVLVTGYFSKNDTKAISLEASTNTINNIGIVDKTVEEPVGTAVDEEVAEVYYMINNDNKDLASPEINYYGCIEEVVQGFKDGNVDIIQQFFGQSDVFSPEVVADRVSVSEITEIETTSNEDGTTTVEIHICTIDYNLMNSDFLEIETAEKELYDASVANGSTPEISYTDKAKRAVAENLLDGKYDVGYNIPVLVNTDGTVVPTEAFKQAITGGWYNGIGIELTSVKCK